MNMIGKKIRELRNRNGWSQGDFARQLDISIPAFSKIETGITDINLSRLEEIASTLGISTVELLTIEDEKAVNEYRTLEDIQFQLKVQQEEIIELQNKMIELLDLLHQSKKTI